MAHVTYKSTLPERKAVLERGIPIVVEKTAADATRIAKEKSRVDTGAMRAGWTFSMVGPKRAIVGNAQEHSVYNEYGTRHMSAQPMIRPAIVQVSQPFFDAISQLLTQAGQR